MASLELEMESLLTHPDELENKTAQVECQMVQRLGDVLAVSIDCIRELHTTSERNGQSWRPPTGSYPAEGDAAPDRDLHWGPQTQGGHD